MTERLTFNYGTRRRDAPGVGGSGAGGTGHNPPRPAQPDTAVSVAPRRVRDWDYYGLVAFTAILFFRPQDQIPALGALHLAELSALFALSAMLYRRLSQSMPLTRVTPELIGVFALGGLIVLTIPVSIWPTGSLRVLTEMYVKVVLIFVLMLNTLDSPKRLRAFTWLIVIASAYLASRAVLDYVRGANLIEYGRVRGAVGGVFRNPNDLALNLVAFLPFAIGAALRRTGGALERAGGAAAALAMLAAIICTHSRSGALGLVAMALVIAGFGLRRRPGLVIGAGLCVVLALPVVPASFWNRMASITDERLDDTGSREARAILLRESLDAFWDAPLTGVGAGQFKNYQPDEREEAWRETHNLILQLGTELGIFGVLIFMGLIAAGVLAIGKARRLLRTNGPPGADRPAVSPEEADFLDAHTAASAAALAGWFVCALFASVAYNWTFYYVLALAAMPREILRDRLRLARRAFSGSAGPVRATEAHSV
jgi:O-antigen ligase